MMIVRSIRTIDTNSENDLIEYIVMIKGAPEVIIKLCSNIRLNNGDAPITPERMEDFQVFLNFNHSNNN